MELRQLAYLIAVAEEASFTRAALRLHVAQPGVSAQIRRLEREIGQALLDRSGRSVRLTDVGRAVLPYARAALSAVEGARQAADDLAGLVRCRAAVGMAPGCAGLGIPGLLDAFHRLHPGVEVTLLEADSKRLLEALGAGRLDLAFAGLGPKAPRGLETHTVVDEPIVAAVAEGDDLAGRGAIGVSALRGRPVISLPKGSGLRSVLDDACQRSAFIPRIAFEASSPNVLAQLAGRGLGVAIVPASVARAHTESVRAVAFSPPLRGILALAWRAEGPMSPAAASLLTIARRHFPATDGAPPSGTAP